MKRYLLIGCLAGASFFFGCQQNAGEKASRNTAGEKEKTAKELEMYQPSELAQLMRRMYEENLALRDTLLAGKLPATFPKNFQRIHSAPSTSGEHEEATFKALAQRYTRHYDSLKKAPNPRAAKAAYNGMVQTCAACHQNYCRGPLGKIKRMRISAAEL
jgi:cytochrome c556